MFDALFETISEDTTKEQLTPMDIMIIDLDTLSYSNNYSKLITYLNAVNEDRLSREDTDFKFRIHTAGAASPEDFQEQLYCILQCSKSKRKRSLWSM